MMKSPARQGSSSSLGFLFAKWGSWTGWTLRMPLTHKNQQVFQGSSSKDMMIHGKEFFGDTEFGEKSSVPFTSRTVISLTLHSGKWVQSPLLILLDVKTQSEMKREVTSHWQITFFSVSPQRWIWRAQCLPLSSWKGPERVTIPTAKPGRKACLRCLLQQRATWSALGLGDSEDWKQIKPWLK